MFQQSFKLLLPIVFFHSSHVVAIAAQTASPPSYNNIVEMKIIIKASDKSTKNESSTNKPLHIKANDIQINRDKNNILSDFTTGFKILVAQIFQELSLEGWEGDCDDQVGVGMSAGSDGNVTNGTSSTESERTGQQEEGDGLFRNLEVSGNEKVIKSSTLFSYSTEEKIGTLNVVDLEDILCPCRLMDTPEDFENCVLFNTTFTPVKGGVLDCNANVRNDFMDSLYRSLRSRGRLHDTMKDAIRDTIIDKLDESVSDAEFETRYNVGNLTERCVSSYFLYPQDFILLCLSVIICSSPFIILYGWLEYQQGRQSCCCQIFLSLSGADYV
mmetsp:Transcript_26468/g.55739  ORF Transcript_26468/g.55739 Transcript_26468/m.55739 type:complete len:328 (+) Transcript_26468:31-1014(+)